MKKLQEEKTELESKLSAKDEEVNTLKLLSEQASSKLVGVFCFAVNRRNQNHRAQSSRL